MDLSGWFVVTEYGVFNVFVAYFLWEAEADEYAARLQKEYPGMIYGVGKV